MEAFYARQGDSGTEKGIIFVKSEKQSIYQKLTQELKAHQRQSQVPGIVPIGKIIRQFREQKKLSGVELCRLSGGLDPRTLTAIEKGRIQNPSIKILQALARGLNVTVSSFFREAELDSEEYCYLGTAKGTFQMDFPSWGTKVVSYTPLVKDFFCGKFIIGPRRELNYTHLKHPVPMFISVLVGRFDIMIENRKQSLKEGENLFFNGILKHSFYNPLQRDSVFWLVTAPSFL